MSTRLMRPTAAWAVDGIQQWAEQRRNLFTNPSFEAATGAVPNDIVYGSSQVVQDAEWSVRGNFSARITPTGTQNDTRLSLGGDSGGMRLGMQAGKTYTVIGTCRLAAPQNTAGIRDRARTITAFYHVGSTYVETRSAQAPNVAGETELRVTFTIPADANEAFVRLYNGATLGNGDVWWDAVAVIEGEYTGPAFDGGSLDMFTARTRWLGAPDVSQSVWEVLEGTSIVEGTAGVDMSRVPYAAASFQVPRVDDTLGELLDPRNGQRVQIQAGDDLAGTSRLFDLGIRSRTVDHRQKLIRIEAASDEALLMDYAPLVDDWGPYDVAGSLRAVCDYVLGKIGASLAAAPATDADVTPHWNQTNLIPNPNCNVDTTHWGAVFTGGGAGSLTRGVPGGATIPGGNPGGYARVNVATGTAGIVSARYGVAVADNIPNVTAGTMYTASGFIVHNNPGVKQIRLWVGFKDDTGRTILGVTQYATADPNTWAPITISAIAPVGATHAALEYGVNDGMSAGQFVGVTGCVLAEGTLNDLWHDGSKPDDANYTYDWQPDPNNSPSARTAIVERPLESLKWPAGTSAWAFLEPLCASVGLRLFCDEQRVWRLIDPQTYSLDRTVTAAPYNTTEGTDGIDRDDAQYITGVIVRYTWTDEAGTARTRDDTAGEAGKVLLIELPTPFPGAGVAAAILTRRAGQGRVQDVTCLPDWAATPGMGAAISLPGTTDQLGTVQSVEWDLATGLMRLGTRGILPAGPGTWLNAAWDISWATVPDTTTWATA